MASNSLIGLSIADKAKGPNQALDAIPKAPRRGGVVYAERESATRIAQHPCPSENKMARKEAEALTVADARG